MTEPRGDRPHIPGYGVPTTLVGTLPWSWALERLEGATIYWLATTGADAAPHMIPIWGSWTGGRWYVEGGPTRWQRNLRENPQLAIKVESGDEVVIVEALMATPPTCRSTMPKIIMPRPLAASGMLGRRSTAFIPR